MSEKYVYHKDDKIRLFRRERGAQIDLGTYSIEEWKEAGYLHTREEQLIIVAMIEAVHDNNIVTGDNHEVVIKED